MELNTGPRILVVEEDRDIGDALDTLLREEGYEPTVVASHAEALVLVERQPFALVVTDLLGWWPGKGLEHELRLCERARPTPVGILTAWPLRAEMVQQLGFAFLAPMPFDMGTLSRHIAAAVREPAACGARSGWWSA